MDNGMLNDIGNFIGTVGFPIFSFILCAWFIKYSYDKSMTLMKESLDKIGILTEAVNNNTKILADLVEKSDNIKLG